MAEFVLCIQWVLFAKRPLSPAELYFALLTGLDFNAVKDNMHNRAVTVEDMTRFVLSASKGLVEVTHSTSAKTRIVQFIHESVRDYLLREDGLSRISPDLKSNVVGLTHDKLRRCCLNYLIALYDTHRDDQSQSSSSGGESDGTLESGSERRLGEETDEEGRVYPETDSEEDAAASDNASQSADVESDGESIRNTDDIWDAVSRRTASTDPTAVSSRASLQALPLASQDFQDRSSTYLHHFLEYAARTVLWHGDVALGNGVPQDDLFIETSRLKQWIEAINNLQERPVYTTEASPLYVFAEQNLPYLIRHELQRIPTMDIAGETYKYPVFVALALGNIEALVALLMQEADSEEFRKRLPPFISDDLSETKQTPLTWAISHRHKAFAEMLLDTGKVELGLEDETGRTPLLCAVEQGFKDLVARLHGSGKVAVDTADDSSLAPLFWAAASGCLDVVQYIFETGEVNVGVRKGQVALSQASEDGNLDIVRYLVQTCKVDPKTKCELGRTALHAAASGGQLPVVEWLCQFAPECADWPDNFGTTPLLIALASDHTAVTGFLLKAGLADVRSRDDRRRTPLFLASYWGCASTVKQLLDRDLTPADINKKSCDGSTALSRAAFRGHELVVELLLNSKRAKADPIDRFGRTPLFWAVWSGYEGVVRQLLETNRVDVGVTDVDGLTPKLCATLRGHRHIHTLLREYRRNPASDGEVQDCHQVAEEATEDESDDAFKIDGGDSNGDSKSNSNGKSDSDSDSDQESMDVPVGETNFSPAVF